MDETAFNYDSRTCWPVQIKVGISIQSFIIYIIKDRNWNRILKKMLTINCCMKKQEGLTFCGHPAARDKQITLLDRDNMKRRESHQATIAVSWWSVGNNSWETDVKESWIISIYMELGLPPKQRFIANIIIIMKSCGLKLMYLTVRCINFIFVSNEMEIILFSASRAFLVRQRSSKDGSI